MTWILAQDFSLPEGLPWYVYALAVVVPLLIAVAQLFQVWQQGNTRKSLKELDSEYKEAEAERKADREERRSRDEQMKTVIESMLAVNQSLLRQMADNRQSVERKDDRYFQAIEDLRGVIATNNRNSASLVGAITQQSNAVESHTEIVQAQTKTIAELREENAKTQKIIRDGVDDTQSEVAGVRASLENLISKWAPRLESALKDRNASDDDLRQFVAQAQSNFDASVQEFRELVIELKAIEERTNETSTTNDDGDPVAVGAGGADDGAGDGDG